jgi:hypothetical protein
MTRLSSNAALNELARDCISEGWVVEQTNGNHLKWTAPNGEFVFSASTPGDQRVYRNHIALLRQVWPEWRAREKRDEDKPRRHRPKAKPARGRIWWGRSKEAVAIPVAEPGPTLAALWPDADLIIPLPPHGWAAMRRVADAYPHQGPDCAPNSQIDVVK